MSSTPYWKDELKVGGVVLKYSDCQGAAGEDEFERIVRDLQAGMPGYNVPQYFGSQPGIFRKYSHLVVAQTADSHETVGLFGAKWFVGPTRRFLYFWTAMVAESHRRTAVTSAMVLWTLERAAAADGVPDVLASKTYSPVAFQALALINEVFPGVEFYPRTDNGPQSPKLVERARELVTMLCPTLDVDFETSVVRGGQAVLAPEFFPNPMPLSGDANVDRFFSRLTRDDQILVLVDVPTEAQAAFTRVLSVARQDGFRIRRISKAASAA
jgi:hypothetical protein